MEKAISIYKQWSVGFRLKLNDYLMLTKFRLSLVVVFSAIMAALIAMAMTTGINLPALAILTIGGFFVTGAANALNQVLEKDYDQLMERTADRPLAAGRMKTSEGVMVAGMLSLIGIIMLALFNPITAFIGMLSLIIYAFIYTPFKRVSPFAVLIGAIPGALPVVIGYVAVTGRLDWMVLFLFAIQFFWQFPHFWSIAWLADEDYKRAGFQLLPNKAGVLDRSVGQIAMIYAGILTGISVLPVFMHVLPWYSAVILFGIGAYFTWRSYGLMQRCDKRSAKALLFASLFYLPIALGAIYVGV